MRAGALIWRTIPGIAAFSWSGSLAAAVFWLHNHYQAPLTGVPARADPDSKVR